MAMAMVAGRRCLQRAVRHAATAAAPAVQVTQESTRREAGRSAKVSDRMLEMTAIDEDGGRHVVKGLTGHTLLRTLVQGGLFDPERHRLEDITACNGECEVSIANEWLVKLPPRTEDELDVLQAKTFSKLADPHSRLGCQIILEPELEGMVVSIAEEKPWRTL